MSAYQYVYHMDKLSKTYPGAAKPVFDGISLHFLPDAKIGVVGVNGAGKSTLLKIMAGLDTEFNGEAWAEKGVKVGYLPQEPQLDESKTVWENVIEGSELKKLVDDFNAVSVKLAEDYTDELMAEMTELQEKIDAADAWDIDSKIEMAMDALRCPPSEWGSRTCPVVNAVAWPCVACCCPSRTCCCLTNRPTTSTPKACSGSSTIWKSSRALSWS